MTNLKRVENVLRYLSGLECREAVICAGARNAPLVVALNGQAQTKVWPLFDERSAAFFALGRIKATGRPVAVVTTSGTAAAELLPAVVEAHYTGLPLLLVTADRPPEYRGTGAPQAIDQVGLFANYVEASVDLWNEPPIHSWSQRRPLHLNVCLAEPSRAELQEIENLFGKWSRDESHRFPEPVRMKSQSEYALVQKSKIDFFARSKNPVIVVSALAPKDRLAVKQWLLRVERPAYLESPSGLCGDADLRGLQIKGGERAVDHGLSQGWADGVIRIGGVPTLRAWRDLETKFRGLPVISFSAQPFSGLSRDESRCLALGELEHFHPPALSWERPWDEVQAAAQSGLESLLRRHPRSEPGMIYALAKQIPPEAKVYLGNSLPIREWDLVATQLGKHWQVEANRGANGIDGQLSTFLGFAGEDTSNWAVVGDLTALYDLSAPYILRQRPLKNCHIVVVNNRGGQIFSRMYSRLELENRHGVEFSSWARMWDLAYELWSEVPDGIPSDGGPGVIELAPDDEATATFWTEWERLWHDLAKR